MNPKKAKVDKVDREFNLGKIVEFKIPKGYSIKYFEVIKDVCYMYCEKTVKYYKLISPKLKTK